MKVFSLHINLLKIISLIIAHPATKVVGFFYFFLAEKILGERLYFTGCTPVHREGGCLSVLGQKSKKMGQTGGDVGTQVN